MNPGPAAEPNAEAPKAPHPAPRARLPRAEVWIALALSVLAIAYHVRFFHHAGGLWRDEVNSVNMATLPHVRDIWNNSQYDSFPMLWFMILRGWHAVGIGGSDIGWRALGLIVGVLVIGVAWLNPRLLGYRAPIVVIGLLALNPEVVRWGDSLRAWGIGLALLLLLFAMIWRAVERTTPKRVMIAMIVGVLAAQALYYNSVMLLALCVAGAVVCVMRRRWRDAIVVLLIGLPAALSMVPYIGTIRRVRAWSGLVQVHFTLGRLWEMLSHTLAAPHVLVLYLWLVLVALAIGVAVARQSSRAISSAVRDLSLFSLVTLLITIPAYVIFLFQVSYETQSWYYFALMTVVAACCEAIFLPQLRRRETRVALGFALVAAALISLPNSWSALEARQTSVDLQARELSSAADKDDVIVVYPWFVGLTFNRYYTGSAHWLTLPEVDFLTYHRFDISKRLMTHPASALDSVFAAMERALSSGHKVWIVGSLPTVTENEVPLEMPPAPNPQSGWQESAYNRNWAMRTSYFLRTHAQHVRASHLDQPVQPYEDQPLLVVWGWNAP